MSKYPCEHDNFSLEILKEYGYRIYFKELFDSDIFPMMANGHCNEECKTKMKEIYKIAIEQFTSSAQRYFEDARIIEYENQTEDSDLIHYERFFELKELREDPIDGQYKFLNSNEIKVDPIDWEYKLVLINFKVGILNGKPVRFCDLPEGTKCDYDADNLPENCTEVGILNGKPVRFCDLPKGTKCDYDADNLPENCTDHLNNGKRSDVESIVKQCFTVATPLDNQNLPSSYYSNYYNKKQIFKYYY
ncbi:hypothetical protein ACTFIZ_006963 [Dictyostelium cf. discoideum]